MRLADVTRHIMTALSHRHTLLLISPLIFCLLVSDLFARNVA